MSAIVVRPLASSKDLKTFIKLPWTIYAGDPMWVPPLLMDRKKQADILKMSYGDESSREIVVMAPSLDEAIAQMKAAMSKSTEAPSHFKVKACYYESEED